MIIIMTKARIPPIIPRTKGMLIVKCLPLSEEESSPLESDLELFPFPEFLWPWGDDSGGDDTCDDDENVEFED